MSSQRPAWPGLGLHVWILWALATAPLLDLLRRYPEFLIVHDVGLARLGLLLAILLVALPLPWVLAAGVARWRAAWAPLVLFPPLVLLGLALCVGAGLGGGIALPLTPVLAAVAVGLYRRARVLRRYCTWLLPVALLSPLLLLSDASVRRLWLPRPAATTTGGSATGAPAVVLVLDELPVSTLLDDSGNLDGARFPNLAALAAQAHWFDNVVSVDSSTPKAVSALLTGSQLPRDRLPIARDLPDNLFTLLAPTYRVVALEPVTRLCPREINALAESDDRRQDWLRDTAIVALHLVTPEPVAARLPAIDSQWAGFGDPVPDATSDSEDEATNWKTIFRRAGRVVRRDRIAAFDGWLESIDERRQGVLYFAHLLLPHRPWVYLPSGSTYRALGLGDSGVFQDKSWPLSPVYAAQAHQRHLLQAQFVDQLIGRLVERLRDAGIYDSALIAITADHGISFRPGEMKRGVTPGNRDDVLQVPLLLKLPGQSEGTVHPESRSTLDLLPTVLTALGVEPPAASEGRSLFDPPRTGRDAPWRSALDRRRRSFGPIAHHGAPFAIGPAAEWLGRTLGGLEHDTRFELTLGAPGWHFERLVGSQPVPAWIYGRLDGPQPARPLGLAIAVDGVVRATTEYDPGDGSGYFRALVPESAIADGAHELAIVIVDPATGRGVLPLAR